MVTRNSIVSIALLTLSLVSGCTSIGTAGPQAGPVLVEPGQPPAVRHKTVEIAGQTIFYREAGDPSRPAVVLLHGFPASSHMYREVLRGLGDEYYLVAPDYPGFGNSSFPAPDEFEYTFDNLGVVMGEFLEALNLGTYTLMIQDYGAPIGFRIALAHPERVDGIIAMNGNAYEEGLGEAGWGPIFDYWDNKSPEIESQIAANVFTLEGMRWQYTHGTRNPEGVSPDNWNLDYLKISRPGQTHVQLDLFYDYQNNVTAYPEWQAYLREHQPPMLIVWGKNDAFFPPEGAMAYLRDVPQADLHLLDTGHFALEEESPFIIAEMRRFLSVLHP
ncbi:MAG: alpha/beta hydrolase [Planctomycetota bacterium]